MDLSKHNHKGFSSLSLQQYANLVLWVRGGITKNSYHPPHLLNNVLSPSPSWYISNFSLTSLFSLTSFSLLEHFNTSFLSHATLFLLTKTFNILQYLFCSFNPPPPRYSQLYLWCWIGRLAQEKAAVNTAAPLSLLTHYLSLREKLRRKCRPQCLSPSSTTPLHQSEDMCCLANPFSTYWVPFNMKRN